MAHTMMHSPHVPCSKFEMILMGLSGVIRDKPEWFLKVNNPDITNKWKDEVCGGMPDEALPEVISSFLREIIDDGDRPYKEEEDAVYYEEAEEDLEAAGFEPESLDDIVELLRADYEIELEDLLHEHLKVQANEDGYLKPKPSTPAADREKDENKRGETTDDAEDLEEDEGEGEEEEDVTAYLNTIWETNKDTMYKPLQRELLSSSFLTH